MPFGNYSTGQLSVYGYRLQKYLEQATANQLMTLKKLMCIKLKEAYEGVSAKYVLIEIDLPGGAEKDPDMKGVEDPRQPGDEPDEPIISVHVGDGYKEEQLQILNEAIRWGCQWAQEEMLRLGGSLQAGRMSKK